MIDRFAYSGDALLRDIFQTPIIDVDYSNPTVRYNNYKAFCNALYKFKNLNNYTVMPGHMDYIVSVNDTVLFYVNKMFNRLIKIKDKITVWPLEDLAIYVAGENVDPYIKYLKASEIIFFKDYLEEPEKLKDALTYLGIFMGEIEKYYYLSLN
jgi:2,4-dienoyl-CoA reductase (NADPH2)